MTSQEQNHLLATTLDAKMPLDAIKRLCASIAQTLQFDLGVPVHEREVHSAIDNWIGIYRNERFAPKTDGVRCYQCGEVMPDDSYARTYGRCAKHMDGK
jgi:hypothetical protein